MIKNWIALINSLSEDVPSTQTPVVNLIQDGISLDSPAEPCTVGGIRIILSSIRNWIALINSLSEEFPSTQTPEVNLIQSGTWPWQNGS